MAAQTQHVTVTCDYEETPLRQRRIGGAVWTCCSEILRQQRAGVCGGEGERGAHVPKAALFGSLRRLRLGLLFLFFFSLETGQNIKDDLIAENILILSLNHPMSL